MGQSASNPANVSQQELTFFIDDPVFTEGTQVDKWKEIALSDTDRVVRTLVNDDGQTAGESDTQANVEPILCALAEIVTSRTGGEDKGWETLVDHGIADALCRKFCSLSLDFASPSVETSPELLEKIPNKLWSPCHKSLGILCAAAVSFKQPLRKTDKKIIAALRKHWPNMTAIIWNAPDDFLRPEGVEFHAKVHTLFARLVAQLLQVDPNFWSILDEPNDLTLQVLAQYWKDDSQQLSDLNLTASFFTYLLELKNPDNIAGVHSSYFNSSQSNILSRILRGLGSKAHSSKEQEASTLMTTFSEHLVRQTDPQCMTEDQNFFMKVLQVANDIQTRPEIWKQVLTSAPLWNGMLKSLTKVAKPTLTPSNAKSLPTCSEEMRMERVSGTLFLFENILYAAYTKHRRECESLIRIWANEGLFDVLEEIAEIIVDIPGVPKQLARLMGMMEEVVVRGPALLKRTYATQFPRWKIFSTFLKHSSDKRQTPGGKISSLHPISKITITLRELAVQRHDNDPFWDSAVWQTFGMLQLTCMDKAMCGKRGCKNAGRHVCLCKAVKYCSEACRASDEKDHRLACGLIGAPNRVDFDGAVLNTTSLPKSGSMKTSGKANLKTALSEERGEPPPENVQTQHGTATNKKKKKNKKKKSKSVPCEVLVEEEVEEDTPIGLQDQDSADDFFNLCRDVHDMVFPSV